MLTVAYLGMTSAILIHSEDERLVVLPGIVYPKMLHNFGLGKPAETGGIMSSVENNR